MVSSISGQANVLGEEQVFKQEIQKLNRYVQKNLHSGTTAGRAVLPLGNNPWYQVPTKAQLQRYLRRYRSCQAWRYYRCTTGSTARTLRLITKESSGSTRHVPLRYRRGVLRAKLVCRYLQRYYHCLKHTVHRGTSAGVMYVGQQGSLSRWSGTTARQAGSRQ